MRPLPYSRARWKKSGGNQGPRHKTPNLHTQRKDIRDSRKSRPRLRQSRGYMALSKVEKRGYTLGTLYQKEWGQLKHLFPRKAHGRCLRASTPDLYPQTLTSDSGSCLSSRSGLREVDNRSIRLTQPLRADGTASAATLPSLPSTEKPIARTCILPEGCGLEVRRAD